MKAVQVVGYHTKMQLADVPNPEISGPFDVVVRIGGAGVCRTDLHVLEVNGRPRPAWNCPIRSVTRTPDGSMRSATPSRTSKLVTR